MKRRSAPTSTLRSLNARADGFLAAAIAVASLACGLAACGGSSSGQTPHDGGGLGGAAGSTPVNTAGTSGGGGRVDGGSAGATGAGGSSADAGATGDRLGLTCAADADCGTGLRCLKGSDKVIAGAGGPANGYCTMACTPAGAVDPCASIGGICFDYQPVMGGAPQAYCMKTCVFGGTTLDNRVAKCQNRPDVACVQGNGTAGFCLPTCSQDVDCPTGRKCDLRFNVCMDTPTAGDKAGAHCTVDTVANTTNCAGTCLQFGSATAVTASMCSARCVLGELGACNWVDQTMSVAGGTHGVCLFPSAANAFAGDLGFCTPECDGNNDCPDTVDHATCDLTVVADVGHGACSFTPPAPDAGTDAGADARRD